MSYDQGGSTSGEDAELGSIEWEDGVVEKLLTRMKEQESESVRLGGSTEDAAQTSEGEVLYSCIKGLFKVGCEV